MEKEDKGRRGEGGGIRERKRGKEEERRRE